MQFSRTDRDMFGSGHVNPNQETILHCPSEQYQLVREGEGIASRHGGGIHDNVYHDADRAGSSFTSTIRACGFEGRDIYTYSSTRQYAFAADTAGRDNIGPACHGDRVRTAGRGRSSENGT